MWFHASSASLRLDESPRERARLATCRYAAGGLRRVDFDHASSRPAA
jgi:hypothetical protein